MATATVAQSEPAAIPRCLSEAIKQGWRIVAEKSKSTPGMRCGSVTLELDNRRVSVFYFADKDGYHFGSLKALAAGIQSRRA
jgi:hypothetical protein